VCCIFVSVDLTCSLMLCVCHFSMVLVTGARLTGACGRFPVWRRGSPSEGEAPSLESNLVVSGRHPNMCVCM